MQTKYTPGPWEAVGPQIITEDRSFLIAEIAFSAHGREVEEIANARLIAAAPEMVEMLRTLRFHFELLGGTGITSRKLLAESAALLARIDGGAE